MRDCIAYVDSDSLKKRLVYGVDVVVYDSYIANILYGFVLVSLGLFSIWTYGAEHFQVVVEGETISAQITGKVGHTVRESRFEKGNIFKSEKQLIRHHWRYTLNSSSLAYVDTTESHEIGDFVEVTYSAKNTGFAVMGDKSSALHLALLWATVMLACSVFGVALIRSGFRQWSQSM